jgi:hypothetical protein
MSHFSWASKTWRQINVRNSLRDRRKGPTGLNFPGSLWNREAPGREIKGNESY